MTTADPTRAAWENSGSPSPGVALSVDAVCTRCAGPGPCADAQQVVSAKFGGWDRIRQQDKHPVLCAGCAWAHRDDTLRTGALLVEPGRMLRLDRDGLARALDAPVGPQQAVTVPQGRRKHLLPVARWGTVTTDQGSFGWSVNDCALARVARDLRSEGVSLRDAAHDDPPAGAFRAVPVERLAHAMELWSRLAPWRAVPPLLAVGLAASLGTP